MPQCPRCHKNISHLNHYQAHEAKSEFSVNPEGDKWEVEVARYPLDTMMDDWECPGCGESLFMTEKDAITFLQGKPVEAMPQLCTIEIGNWIVSQAQNRRDEILQAAAL